ncbi:MAG: hypothetical protein ACTSRK_16980 [Promethearchaeota archaeon]
MGNFWNEVDEALEKGKESKLVKVRAKDLADFRTKLTELENEISIAQNRNQTLTEIKMDMTKQIEILQKSQSSLDHTVEGQIHNQNEMIEEMEKEIGEKEKEYDDFQIKSGKKDRLIKEFKQKLDEAIKKIKSQVVENNTLGSKIQELEVKNVDLQTELLQNKGSQLSDEELASQEQVINTLTREKKHLEVDLKEKDAEIQMYKVKLEKIKLNPQSDQIDKQIIEIQTELEKSNLEISQERQDFNLLKKSMKQELELAQMKITELDEAKNLAVSELEKEIMHLRNTHQQEIEHIQSQIAESGDITFEVAASGSGGGDPKVVDLIAKLRVSNAKVQELQLKSRKLNNSLRKTQSDFDTLEAEVIEFRTNSVPKSEFESIQHTFTQLKEKTGALAKNRELLLSENESLRVQLETSQGSASQATEPISRSRAPARKLDYESASFANEVAHSTARIKCPRCDSTKLKEVEDKTSIISYVPTTTYSKITLCTQCGYKFK